MQSLVLAADVISPGIDVKNINLQIKKNKKNMFFHFYKKNI